MVRWNHWIIQQDSDPCQKARTVETWSAQNNIELLPLAGNSPDMKPIESLWNILKDEVRREQNTTKRALRERLIMVWFQ